MKQTLAIYVLILLALVTANLPFLSERVFGAVAFRRDGALYLVVGGIGLGFEASLGNVFPQGWQFYAITLTLYLVLAYPGFVYRYLFKRTAR